MILSNCVKFNALMQESVALGRDIVREASSHRNWDRKTVLNYQRQQLRQFLTHAKKHSPYYRDSLANIDTENAEVEDLRQVPPLTKKMVMANWDAIICDRTITRDIAEAHMAKLRSGELDNPYYKDKYLFFATGGTSGFRGLFVWDKHFHATCLALVYRYSLVDDKKRMFPDGKRLVALTAPTMLHASTFLYAYPLDPEITVHHIPANLSTTALIDAIEAIQPTHLIGFTSVIARLAQLVEHGRLSCAPQRVSVNSEPLDDDMRARIKAVWGIGVNNGWGSLETGLDAVEDDAFAGLIMAEDYCVFEPVTANLAPTDDAEAINKILVTSTFNYTFPLIRYVLDDTLVFADLPHNVGFNKIKAIVGRADESFVYGDTVVHPSIFRAALTAFAAIQEYQLEQTKQGIIVRLILDGELDQKTLQHLLIESLRDANLAQPQVTIECLDSLPRHTETGKVKRYLPLKATVPS